MAMQYQEKKTGDDWHYYSAGVFGELEIESSKQLTGEQLDGIVHLLITDKGTEQERLGTIKVSDDHIISYRFKKTLTWGDEAVQPIDTCKDTPTDTKPADSESTETRHSGITQLTNWFRRFVVAFREAWQRSQNR